jgi:hypothetical protein
VRLFHALQQPHGPLAMQQEILVHHEERFDLQLILHAAHDVKQFIARLKEVDELPLAAKERRGRTEVASQRTADGGNNRRRRRALAFGQTNVHDPCAHSGNDRRMLDRRALVFSQIASHPRNAFALHNVIGVDHLFNPGDGAHVPVHYDHRMRREFTRHAAHLAHLGHVHHDSREADHVVMLRLQLAGKVFPRGKVEHGAGRGNIRLDHHDAPGAMKHAQRKAALNARDLIVIELHRIDGAAAELVGL